MALSSPPTLQALAVEVVWNRRGTSCSTFGHTAPSPFTEVREWLSWVAALRLFQRGRTAPFLLRDLFPHRHSGAGRNPVAPVHGGRENLPLLLLDPGLRRDDGQAWGALNRRGPTAGGVRAKHTCGHSATNPGGPAPGQARSVIGTSDRGR